MSKKNDTGQDFSGPGMFSQVALELLRTALEQVPDVVFIKDIQLRYVYVNHAFLQRNAIASHEEVIGRDVFTALPTDTARLCHAMDERVLESGQVESTEATHLVNGPDFMRSHITLTPAKNANGEVSGLLGIVRDITADYDRHLNHLAMEECLTGRDERPLKPVCSGCRAFRSSEGHWIEPDTHAKFRPSSAYLTHSLCSECLKLFTA